MSDSLSVAAVEERIRLCQGHWVLADADLAAFHGLSPEALHQRVRLYGPLPGEFGFYPDNGSLPAGGSRGFRAGRVPLVFTEYGVVAVAYMLGSPAAIVRSAGLLHAFARVRSPTRPWGADLAAERMASCV
jgi:hypothetical protein